MIIRNKGSEKIDITDIQRWLSLAVFDRSADLATLHDRMTSFKPTPDNLNENLFFNHFQSLYLDINRIN
ncbi:hypothetical protein MM221_11655 [Salipaludibacillus sp. LMS25]|uniref:hypothetical protein n=1 Tax=Salipaludibacillus sp. LMS25 TaxID=2924031 RepID=UPI0020D06EDA|nr:hypothetical protein [Salipaludibacillus sp. LMS25]UTR13301.1 hypothetical protein MM221_11655 [Salipaludibacillus sp. LMS25]